MENFIQMLGNVWKQPLTRRNAGKEGYLWHTKSVIEVIIWAFLTLVAVSASPCLLKAEAPAHLLNASPAVLLKHRKLHTWEECWVKNSIIREPRRFDFLQSPAWPPRILNLKLCLLFPDLLPIAPGVPGNVCNAWLCGEGRQGSL